MKVGLNKKLRISLMLFFVIIIGVLSFFLYNEVKVPKFSEEQTSLYQYKTNADINYRVFLKPNILFDEESQGEEQVYFLEFIDSIKASFHYSFTGESPADIVGDYEITALMEGYNKEGEVEKIIWQKSFPLTSKQSIEIKDKEMTQKEDIVCELSKYNAFADEVAEATKARTSTRLSLYMRVSLKADTDKGMIEETRSPAIVIPLGQPQFTIDKQQVGEKEGSIEETIQVELPIDRKKVTIFAIPIGILIIALFYLIFFTISKPPKSKLERTISKIFKSHGSRLVALDEEKAESYDNYYRVRSIEDLVKISDEIEKPILYQYRSNSNNIKKFYIVDEASIYVLDLKHLIEKPKEAEDKKEEIENKQA